MKALFSSQLPKSKMLFLLSLTVLLGSWLAACDFNVEITDEKRSLEKVGGTPPCASGVRFSEGKSGTQTMRLFLVDDRQNPEALDLGGIDKEPYNLKVESFTIPDKDENDTGVIQVLDATDGSKVSGAKVTLKLVTTGEDNLVIQPNPRYSSLKKTIGNKRVPKAVNLLIDMSETAANEDSSLSRTSAPAAWVLEKFNSDSTQGDLDVFSSLFVMGGEVSTSQNLFKQWDTNKQFIAADGKPRGFILTTDDSKNEISGKFTNISNNKVDGRPPVYAALEASALDTRTISRDTDNDEALFNPGVILISLERDHYLLDNKKVNKLKDAITAAKGRTWDEDQNADFIPMMGVVYPAPDKTTVADWDKYVDSLCQIAQAAGLSRRVYWGQIFQVPANARRSYQTNTRSHLDMAYHALKGYLELKIQYSLSGVKAGRYLVSFKLQAELLQQKSKIEDSPSITFEVRVK